jgi:uncharacterized protein
VTMTAGRVREIWRYPVKSMAGERLDHSAVAVNGLWGDRGWAVRDETTGEIHNAKRYPVLMQCSAVYRSAPGEDTIPHVEITLPDGATVPSDSPDLSRRLSELMRRPPATETRYYRRREPGAALAGRLAQSRLGRRLLQWVLVRGKAAQDLRESFGRESGEPLPDFADVPGSIFEFQTPPGTYFDLYPIHVLTSSTLQRLAALNPAAIWDIRRFRPNVLIETAPTSGALESEWAGRVVRIGAFTIKGEMPTIRCAMTMHAQGDLPRDASVLRTIVRESGQCAGLYASVAAPGRVAISDPVHVSEV